MDARIKVLLVDDELPLRSAWQKLLAMQSDLECVGALASADGVVDAVASTRAAVVLMDLSMPGHDPLTAVAELASACPQCRAIVYSGLNGVAQVRAAMNAGASGFVDKAESPTKILAAIRRVAAGETVFPPNST